MTPPAFDTTLSYRPEWDVRDSTEWCSRLCFSSPEGALWALVGPRRSGKTWQLEAIRRALPAGLATYADLRTSPDGLDASHDGCLLVDEPGGAIAADPAGFAKRCAALRGRGVRVLVAMTPGEWVQLIAADPEENRVRPKKGDLRVLPRLKRSQAEKLAARTPWSAALLPQLPEDWTRNPFLLELLFEVAERRPELRGDLPGLCRAARDKARDDSYYVTSVFGEGLAEVHRRALAAVARRELADAEALRLLRDCGLVDGTTEAPRIADPVLADHLPPPLVIHHLSDLHFGAKPVAAVDAKLGGNTGANLAKAAGPASIRDSYAENLEALRTRGHGPHLLIVSGDIGETGRREEYAAAGPWLSALSKHLAEHPDLDGTTHRVLLVPGNHDVDWSHSAGVAGARQRHLSFAEAFDTYPRPKLEEPPEKRPPAIVRYPDAGLEVILLGASELGGEESNDQARRELVGLLDRLRTEARAKLEAADEETYQRLARQVDRIDPGLVHHRDLQQLTSTPAGLPLRIAVLHHPVTPLPVAPEITPYAGLLNAGAVKDKLLEAGVTLVLHGHQHSGWFGRESWPGRHGGRPLHIAAAPTLGSPETLEPHGYNEIRILREGSATYALQVRRHVRQGNVWVAQGERLEIPVEPSTCHT